MCIELDLFTRFYKDARSTKHKSLPVCQFFSFIFAHGSSAQIKNKIASGHHAKIFQDSLVLTFGILGGGEELEKGYTFFSENLGATSKF